jgi:hypothetical protein
VDSKFYMERSRVTKFVKEEKRWPAGGVAQVVGRLPSKPKAPSSVLKNKTKEVG